MNALGNNATPPIPAIAPGAMDIDVRRAAATFAKRHPHGIDDRVRAILPAFDAPFFQAGLAGYSDAAMRIIARRHGCPFCVTEALLDRTLLAGGRGFAKADLGELHENVPGGPEDHPLACQIMGSDPREMAAAALKAAEQGRRGDKHYRLLAYSHLDDHERTEIESVHLRLPGGSQIGRIRIGDADPSGFDHTEGCSDGFDAITTEPDLSDQTCETLVDAINELPAPAAHLSQNTDLSTHLTTNLSFELIDVNLACPVKKVRSKARGGHWLAEPDGAIKILEAVREAVPAHIPCTVKLRRSYDDSPEMAANFDRIFDAAFSIGYAWATVHARTVEQKYVGPSRWTFLKDLVRRKPNALIFGSGDVWDVGDIFRMLEYTGVVGVSVARGCIGNPWIFRQARQLLAGQPLTSPTLAEQRRVLEEHYRLCAQVNGDRISGRLMRKFGIRFASHHPHADRVRRKFIAVHTIHDWLAVLDSEYSQHAQSMTP